MILWKHCLKNVSVPFLTVLGLLANRLLGGAVVIEVVFAIPGIGSMVVNAAINKDFPVVQGVVLVTVVAIVIAINLVGRRSLPRCLLDPRIASPPHMTAIFRRYRAVSHRAWRRVRRLADRSDLRCWPRRRSRYLGLLLLFALSAPLIAPYFADGAKDINAMLQDPNMPPIGSAPTISAATRSVA